MTFEYSFERNEVYECGAALLTVLTCARNGDDERSLHLYLSLCAKALWLKHIMDPDNCTPIVVNPRYVFRDRKTIDRDVAFVAKRLGERMVAGRMAIPFFQRAALGAAGSLPNGIKRLSVNQMAGLVLKDAGQSEPTNVERRYWAPSRPVIHLAAAAAIIGPQLQKAGKSIFLETFLFHRAFIECVMQLAEELEALAGKDPKFPIKADQLIRCRIS
jgi:hypothetical protein